MDVKYKDMRSKSDVTCLAVIPDVASWTVTLVTVDLVFTAPSVLTRTAGTLVDVCGDQKNKTKQKHTHKKFHRRRQCFALL